MNMTKLPFLAPWLIATSAITFATPALSANETEYSFGGSINTVFLFDSNVSGAGANIPADALYKKETYGDNKIDATLSQLSAGVKRTLNDGSTISARYVMDFNAKNDSSVSPRIREAYLRWNKGSGQIIAGQTWSTLMDIRNLPISVTEPTFSGVAFMRQPQLRWSQSFDTFKYEVAIEDGSNADIVRETGEDVKLDKSTLDLIAAADWDFSANGHVRLTGLLSEKTLHMGGQEHDELGYALQLSMVYNITEKDKVSLVGFHGKGVDRYVLGVSQTGATWNGDDQELELRTVDGAMAAYTRTWQPDLLSVFGVGSAETDPLEWQKDTFTYTRYAMANLIWEAYSNIYLGLEYNYSYYERDTGDELDNHRIAVGVNWKF